MAAHAASRIEHAGGPQRPDIQSGEVLVEVRLAGRRPVVEMRPLVAEARLRASRDVVLGGLDESWDAVPNRGDQAAASAAQRVPGLRLYRRSAARAGQDLQQGVRDHATGARRSWSHRSQPAAPSASRGVNMARRSRASTNWVGTARP